jgi:predicted ArsR family transcriptional regulator
VKRRGTERFDPMAASLQEQARALGHPTRHQIFRYAAEAGRAVDVAELTSHVGLNHNAIRQHLAKLVDAGLLVERKEASGRPGRPRLVYEVDLAAGGRWGVSSPYERLSLLLAEVIRTGETPVEVGRRAGRDPVFAPVRDAGTTAGVAEAMARQGFEPAVEDHGDEVDIILRSCPFQSTALADPDTVCALHLGIAQGLAESVPGAAVNELIARDPRLGHCVLRLRIDAPTSGSHTPGA